MSNRLDVSVASLVLALADDELILGHRHSEWTGFAPHLEEDVAFSSIAQDEIGHGAALYALLAEVDDRSPDDLALGRAPHEYRNAILCERPNRDWAYTLARHWLYDNADDIRLEVLEGSSRPELAALVAKMRREERYHLLHADAWLKRVAHGPLEGRTKLADALGTAFGDALHLFEPIDHEEQAVYQGVLPVPSDELRRRFAERAGAQLDELGLPPATAGRVGSPPEFVASSSGDLIAGSAGGDDGTPDDGAAGSGGRRGRHSEDFLALWDEMTATHRASPGATW